MATSLSSPLPAPAINGARPLRVGFIALTDAAPLVAAQELGLFVQNGLRVELLREIGWATIREKIVYGDLDAAHALAPLLWSAELGLGCPACEVVTAFVLSRNGNAITLSRKLWDAGIRDATTLQEHALARTPRRLVTLGVVFPFSSHHLLLRDWLRSAGLNPEHDVRIVVVPPAQMFRNLAAGTIDGFCAGEPWNTFAVQQGAGWCPAWSLALRPGHVEKVLMVTRRFAETRSAEHAALVHALAEAAAWCDEPSHREQLAHLLAQPRYLNLPVAALLPALTGRFERGHGEPIAAADFHVFHRGGANVPAVATATALQRALVAAGLVAAPSPALPGRLFREDLHREILHPYPHEIAS